MVGPSTLASVDLAELADLAARARALMASGQRVVLGIVGPPGVGKSTLAQALVREIGERAAYLPMDGFHLPQARLRALGTRDRMGAPETFDAGAYATLVEAVVASPGMSLTAPGFDRTVEEPVPDGVRIGAAALLVVTEGNYLLLPGDDWERARARMAAVWQLRLAEEVRRERLLARHIAFGKSPAQALEWMTRVDEPNARLVQSYAARADHIVDVT